MSGLETITVGVAPLGWAAGHVQAEVDAEVAQERSPQVTPQQVKTNFRERGETVASWADAHGFPRDVVYRVLNGRTPAWRGQPHQVAVALGLKPAPSKTTA